MAWTEDRVAILTKMWEGGSTATEIAKVLDVTRNAVIGKAHRLGLSGRPSPIKKKKAAPAAKTKAAEKKKAAPKKKEAAKPAAKAASKAATKEEATKPAPKAKAKPAAAAKAEPAKPAKEKAKAKPAPVEKIEIPISTRIEEPEVEHDPNKKGLTLMELTERTCRWPYGDPQDLDSFYFCGAPCEPEVSYCAHHASQAYQQPNQKKDEAAKKAAAQAEARKKKEAAEKAAGGKS
ncbi:MAG: hypothetical protein Alpg2KO_12800 [Alphaproteobacteria bacterium]